MEQRTILVVDDESMITSTIGTLLKLMMKQNVVTYNDPEEAIQSEDVRSGKVDLVISDFLMPNMDGISFLKKVREQSPETVSILLTGYADKENAIKSINEAGVYYYLEKPWDNHHLIKIVQNGLEKKEMQESIRDKNQALAKSNAELMRLYELLKKDFETETDNVRQLMIFLANLIEAKDSYTDGHTRRVSALARAIGELEGFNGAQLAEIEMAGIIHDIGKVGVAEQVLNKPGRLNPEEFSVMKAHPVLGANILRPVGALSGCIDAVLHHHEKLDGSGYPDGLKGDEITIQARILAVADIFDALYSDRPYRERMPMEDALKLMDADVAAGKLDGKIVDHLKKLVTESLEIK